MPSSEDRQALVAEEPEPEPEREPCARVGPDLPWLCALAYRGVRLPAGAGRLTALSALLVALSALLLVQLALLRDAARVAGVGAYPAAVVLALLAAAVTLPAAAAALWGGGRPAARRRTLAAAAVSGAGALLVLAARHRNRLGCNVQDPLVAVLIVFAFVGYLLTADKVRLRGTIAQVVICLGLFIGVSYQACNKYRCHGDDRAPDVWLRAAQDAREQHVLWVAVAASGLAMICGAVMLLESHFHCNTSTGKGGRSSWRDDVVGTALMTAVSCATVALLFWVDLTPGIGESASGAELGAGLARALTALAGPSPHYRRACLLVGGTAPALTLVAVRLLAAGRPTFQLAALVTLGVLVSELWWSVSRIDGAGSWTPHARLTGEAVMAVAGGLLMIGGLLAWLSFAEKKKMANSEMKPREFEVYQVQESDVDATTKYRWHPPESV